MIKLDIPGMKSMVLKNLILDYNGTIALDGKLIPKVKEILNRLQSELTIHILTADTFGTVQNQAKCLKCKVHIISRENQDKSKLEYLEGLNPDETVCIGNGRNDKLMLKRCILGICVVQVECACVETVKSADIIACNIIDALELLLFPRRLIATLRN